MRIITILVFLSLSSYAFAETYADSQSKFVVPIGQEQRNNTANTIKAAVGKDFVITLDANATTGYEWRLANPIDDSLIKFVGSKYVPDKTGLIGSGGKSIWTFKAFRAGKARIFFKYIRPWEKDTPPAKEVTYIVDILIRK